MQRKLKSSGNGWEIYFSKQILKLLGYNPKEVKLLIISNNGELLVEPIDNPQDYSNSMVRGLQKSGGSYALYIPLPLIDVLEINPEIDFIDIIISNNKFTIRKSRQ